MPPSCAASTACPPSPAPPLGPRRSRPASASAWTATRAPSPSWSSRRPPMLTAEQNAELTRVGPGTPMGELLRRYWYPVAFTRQLEEFPVKRVRLLGEDWALYKTPDGAYGVVEEQCPHRRASLAYGVVEPEGLRCGYHGWLFGRDGTCLDQPAELDKTSFKDRVRGPGRPAPGPGGCAGAPTAGCSAATAPAWTSRPSSTRPRSRTGSGPGPAGPRSWGAWSGGTSARSRRRYCPATTSM